MDRETVLKSFPPLPEQFRLSPEFRLLVACSWIAPEELEQLQSEKIISLCHAGINWDAFIALVERHRIPALAYANLRRHAAAQLPEMVRKELKGRSDDARREALRYAAELVRLKRLFDEQGIDVIPLKGQLLSIQLYDDPGMRHSRDLDLLIKPEDLESAHQLLTAEGYHRFPDFELTEKRTGYLIANCQDFWYLHATHQFQLDLHWSNYLWRAEQIAELWSSHSRPMELWGEQVLRLDDDAQLLFLCDHGARHRWFRIKWLSDVAVMFADGRIEDWNTLLALADRLDLKRSLAQAALLVHWLYGIPLAKQVGELISREKTTIPLAIAALREILMNEEEHFLLEKKWGNLRNIRYLLRLRSNPPYRSHLNILLVSIADFKEFPLPDRLFRLYYPLRPLFWLLRHWVKGKAKL